MRIGGPQLGGWVEDLLGGIAKKVNEAKKQEAERQKPPLWVIALVAYIAWEVTS